MAECVCIQFSVFEVKFEFSEGKGKRVGVE